MAISVYVSWSLDLGPMRKCFVSGGHRETQGAEAEEGTEPQNSIQDPMLNDPLLYILLFGSANPGTKPGTHGPGGH